MSVVIHLPEEDTCPYRGPHCECEKYSDYMLEALDYCVVRELEELWESGVKTACSCCGHGTGGAYIVVGRKYRQQMMDMGYQEAEMENQKPVAITPPRLCGRCGVMFRAKTKMPYEIDKEGDADV